jgi:excisionase family DNA binding protein
MEPERHLRVDEVAHLTGYSAVTIRKKLNRREIGFRKIGRILAIPESEVSRLMGELQPAMSGGEGDEVASKTGVVVTPA